MYSEFKSLLYHINKKRNNKKGYYEKELIDTFKYIAYRIYN